jgi:rhodanese-related sulfurtransferase
MAQRITGAELLDVLQDSGGQRAIIDLRTPAERAEGHIAVSAGASFHELEQRIVQLVPAAATPITLVGGPELVDPGVAVLESLGYSDIAVLEDGVDGWKSAGGRVYTGTNVRSKALGEWIEHTHATPTVESATLAQWLAAGDNVVILDSRTPAEYEHHHIPGGYNTGGGAEVTYRAAQVIDDPTTRIVVNCQGRTRGIVGAQSLINTGIANPVYSLHNGTPAWEWAGQPVEYGQGSDLGAPSEVGSELRDWARRTLATAGAAVIGHREAQALLDGAGTTYVLDVRSRDEYAAGHLTAALSTPGGQLVQATDDFIAVRRSRVVLVDTGDLVRAANTVQWLRYLHDGPLSVIVHDEAQDLVRADQVTVPVPTDRRVPWVEVSAWRSAGSARLVDLRSSDKYAAGHVAGSIHARREHLADLAVEGIRLVLIGDREFVAEHLGGEAGDGGDVWILDGGIDAVTEGLVSADPQYAGAVVDRTGPPDFGPERDAWYRAYFEWELALLTASQGDPFLDFDAVRRT